MNSTKVMPITVPTLLLRARALKWRSSPMRRECIPAPLRSTDAPAWVVRQGL